MIDPSRVPPIWRRSVRRLNIDNLFENAALRQRALELFEEGRCRVISADESEILGQVAGRTGTYQVTLWMEPDGAGFECSCPSDYEPCKHTGALLYALQQDLGRTEAQRKREYRAPSGRKPADAGPLGGRPLPTRPAHPAARHQPGSVLGVSVLRAPKTELFNRFEDPEFAVTRFLRREPAPDGGAGAHSRPAVRKAGLFRPAFRLDEVHQYGLHGSGGEITYALKPILVYVRKDGADGRIESYSPGKARMTADQLTEGLIELAWQQPERGLSALRLLSRWRDQASVPPGADLELPIELYLPRADRLEREQGATPRRIAALRISWQPEMSHNKSLALTPMITLEGVDGYSEAIDPAQQYVQSDERGLILPAAGSGTLWYLFDSDLPDQPPHAIAAVADILTLHQSLTYQEVATLCTLCGEQLADLVRIDSPPATLRIVTVIPVPVVNIDENYRGYSFAGLAFRYGDRLLRAPATATLLPVRPQEIERFDIEPDDAPAGTTWFIARSLDAEMEFSDELYAAVDRLPPEQSAWDFLISEGPALLERGFEIRISGKPVSRTRAAARYRVVQSGESWFAVEPGLPDGDGFALIDEVVSERIVRAAGRVYVLEPGSVIPPDFNRRRRRIERRDLASIDEIASQLEDPLHPALREYNELKRKLGSFESIERIDAPAALHGQLRPYQLDGLHWLWFLHSWGLGGILADDMGLGKTIQALALLLAARQRGQMQRALVVCPLSTLSNWHDECRRFAPDLRPLVHGGQTRSRSASDFNDSDVVLVSYDTFLRDAELFGEVSFDYLILDEAQTIKNPNAKRRRALASVDAPHRLALTGTPVENGVVELWSIMDVLTPGLLGSRTVFSRRYAGGRSGGVDPEALARLQRIIRPLVLRRTKSQVAPELPPREEQIIYAELGTRQAAVYEALRQRYETQIAQQVANGEMRESSMMILEAMLRLRQAAILPALVDSAYQTTPGAKLDLMVDLLAEIAAEDNKALVFSQFTSVLDEVERRLVTAVMPRFRLDGSTPQARRAGQIAAFQKHEGSACFLISLKAGGLGINLTAADYVLLLDPWWNPAVEAQAVDRSHRIGRNGTVFAYRLVARGTIEEKMLRLQQRKREVADALIKADQSMLGTLSGDDLLELFSR